MGKWLDMLITGSTVEAAKTVEIELSKPPKLPLPAGEKTPPLARKAVYSVPETPEQYSRIRRWLAFIGESNQVIIDECLEQCRSDPEALAYYLKRSEEAKT